MVNTLFLSSFDGSSRNDNFDRLPDGLAKLGGRVTKVEHDSLFLDSGHLKCQDLNQAIQRVDGFDLIWVLGFGSRVTFMDRMQLLHQVTNVPFVNSVDAFVYRHAKAGLLPKPLDAFQPRTIVANQPSVLYEHLCEDVNWILKPNAGSFGKQVFNLSKEDANARVILETVTENGYALLQERVDTSYEKRVLLVSGKVIGGYGKKSHEFRKNRAAGAIPIQTALIDDELVLASAIAIQLQKLGIQFAAVDIAYPYLLDANFVNPGWLATYEQISGQDLTSEVCSTLLTSLVTKTNHENV